MPNKTLPTLFSEALSIHGYGHAFYEPELSTIVKPGACGFLRNGSWIPLLELNNARDLSSRGLTSCPALQPAPKSEREWGPKISSSLKQRKVDVKAGVSLIPSGIPLDISALYEYETNNEFGALLLTKSPVVKRALYRDEPIKIWVQENALRIKEQWPEVASEGLFIATSTFSTSEASTNFLRSKGQKVSVGFSGSAVGIGEIGPAATWHTAMTDGGWVRSKASGNGNSHQKVVFVGGLYFRWPRLVLPFGNIVKVVPPHKWNLQLRGDSAETIPISPFSDEFTEGQILEVEVVGKYENRLEEEERNEEEIDDDF